MPMALAPPPGGCRASQLCLICALELREKAQKE